MKMEEENIDEQQLTAIKKVGEKESEKDSYQMLSTATEEPFKAVSPYKKEVIMREFTKRIQNSNLNVQEKLPRLAND